MQAPLPEQGMRGRPICCGSACCHSSCELPCLMHGVVLVAAARQRRTGRPIGLSSACCHNSCALPCPMHCVVGEPQLREQAPLPQQCPLQPEQHSPVQGVTGSTLLQRTRPWGCPPM